MDNSTGHQVDIGSAVRFRGVEQSSAPRAPFFQLCNLDDGEVIGLSPSAFNPARVGH
jgi:hypothetical protein